MRVRAVALRGILPVKSAAFPMVGMGASAGGLEALELFRADVPKNRGLAFVIVQHLDPTRQGIMPELLQRTTGMKVIPGSTVAGEVRRAGKTPRQTDAGNGSRHRKSDDKNH